MALEFVSVDDVLEYIQANESGILGELQDKQIKNIWMGASAGVNVMRDGKRLLRVIVRFEGDKKISEFSKDMRDLGLI